MPLPSYDTFMLPLLRALDDGEGHELRELRDRLATEFKLTEQDRAALLPSGKQPVFDNRVGWAKTHLEKAGLLESPRRGLCRITAAGRDVLAKRPERLDKSYLLQFESFRAFAIRGEEESSAPIPPAAPNANTSTPEEALERAYKEIRTKVETDLLEAVSKSSPRFFEKLVVDLLVKMGYGGSLEDAGRALEHRIA